MARAIIIDLAGTDAVCTIFLSLQNQIDQSELDKQKKLCFLILPVKLNILLTVVRHT